MPCFSVSQGECLCSFREISSSFLRHTPENSDANIPSSHRAGVLQGASLPSLLRFLLSPAEQKDVSRITLFLLIKSREFKGSLESWPQNFSSSSSPKVDVIGEQNFYFF